MRIKSLKFISKRLSKNRSEWRKRIRIERKTKNNCRILQAVKANNLIWLHWWIKYKYGK